MSGREHEQLQVLILGHGEMGHAMEHLLRARHRLTIWTRRPAAGAAVDLEAAGSDSDVVLFCVPAQPHFDLAMRLRSVLAPDTPCVTVAKGLDDAGRTPALVFERVFGNARPYACLYGPMIAEEIRANRPAFAELGATSPETHERIRGLFAGTALALHSHTDVAGMSWSAVLKNVYTMLFGLADGLTLGDNMRGYLAAAATDEITRLVATLVGRDATPHPLAALADLVTTATSAGSHHHDLGVLLARGETEGLEGEGVHTIAIAERHGLFDPAPYPLYRLISGILRDPKHARAAMDAYLAVLRR
jgi:glycerol-3-phosphate dehydrogenase (NAD(P)+)